MKRESGNVKSRGATSKVSTLSRAVCMGAQELISLIAPRIVALRKLVLLHRLHLVALLAKQRQDAFRAA